MMTGFQLQRNLSGLHFSADMEKLLNKTQVVRLMAMESGRQCKQKKGRMLSGYIEHANANAAHLDQQHF